MFGDSVWSATPSSSSSRRSSFSRSLPTFPASNKALSLGDGSWPQTSSSKPSRSLAVRNLPLEIRDSDIKALFSQLGDIHTIVTTERKRLGLIVVHFFDIRSAEDTRKRFNGRTLQNCVITITFLILKADAGLASSFFPQYPYPVRGTITLRNLPPLFTKERLFQFCSLYGNVRDVDVEAAQAEFFDVREAYDALQKMNKGGAKLGGNTITAFVTYDPASGKLAEDAAAATTTATPTPQLRQQNQPRANSTSPYTEAHAYMQANGQQNERSSPLGAAPSPAPTGTAAAPGSSPGEIVTAIVATMGQQQKMLLDLQATLIAEMANGEGIAHIAESQRRMAAANTLLNNIMKQSVDFQMAFGSAAATFPAPSTTGAGGAAGGAPQLQGGRGRDSAPVPHDNGHRPAMSAHANVFTPQISFPAGGSTASKKAEKGNSRRRRDPRSGKLYELDIDSILSGRDQRTTIMIQNIPNNYTQQMLLDEINLSFKGSYDFFYLPMDYKNKCNIGYSFVNFLNSKTTAQFFTEFNNRNWSQFKSHKICAIKYGRIQGKGNLIQHFLKTNVVRGAPESYRPLLFYSDGPNAGKAEPFPMT